MTELDPAEISRLMMGVLTSTLSGNSETVDVPVTVTLPKSMLAVLDYIASCYEVSREQLVGALATEGVALRLQQSIEEGLAEAGYSTADLKPPQDETPMTVLESLGINTGNIQDGIGQLQQLSNQIEQMTKAMSDALPTGDPSKDPKDSK